MWGDYLVDLYSIFFIIFNKFYMLVFNWDQYLYRLHLICEQNPYRLQTKLYVYEKKYYKRSFWLSFMIGWLYFCIKFILSLLLATIFESIICQSFGILQLLE